jgi:DNA-binding transcriptional LysR family regulator
MDIDLARTFVAVFETGNFNRAAERLNVTQSTVSTRIQNLEDQLGRTLFQRSRAGTELTSAGRQFHRHAINLVRVWQQARQELLLPENLHDVLSIGTQISLWDELLARWLPWMRKNIPDVALRVEFGFPEVLMRQLQEGVLDVVVMYTPQTRSGLAIETLIEDRLVLVASEAKAHGPGDADYVFVDWGPEFQAEHDVAFANAPYPALSVSHGMFGLGHILNVGGSGYFPLRLVRDYVRAKRLHRVAGAPTFSRPAYVVYPQERAESAPQFVKALDGLRRMAAKR